jgi:regulator of protease activity HflC (stomatin/prohibitin superfamily)
MVLLRYPAPNSANTILSASKPMTPMTVDAVVYFRVVDPEAAVVRVENYLKATSLISQTTLRSVLGQAELDELLSQRDKINLRLQEIIDHQTDPWGIKVTAVEVRDVILPDSMRRAMAGQAESERERRAKIINAEGEFQAAEKLVQAAAMISAQPIALQLRFLQAGFDRNGLYLCSRSEMQYWSTIPLSEPLREIISD